MSFHFPMQTKKCTSILKRISDILNQQPSLHTCTYTIRFDLGATKCTFWMCSGRNCIVTIWFIPYSDIIILQFVKKHYFHINIGFITWVIVKTEIQSFSGNENIWQNSRMSEKGRDRVHSYDKNSYTHREIQKATWQHKNAAKTSITQRLRTD